MFSDTIVFDYIPQSASDTGSLSDVGLFFKLDVTYLSTGQPAQLQPGQTYSMAVTYEPSNAPDGVNEADLALYFLEVTLDPQPELSSTRWVREATSVVDVETNTIVATPNHFSSWAILAPTEQYVYLPIVLR